MRLLNPFISAALNLSRMDNIVFLSSKEPDKAYLLKTSSRIKDLHTRRFLDRLFIPDGLTFGIPKQDIPSCRGIFFEASCHQIK